MISVIIPVYNVEKHVEECFNSLLRQTYKDFEVIVVNDGSTDSSEKIINKYKEKFEKFIYLSQINSGVSVARNNGLKHANGDYVLFMDSDDYLHKEMLEKMIKKVEKTKADVIICGYFRLYEDGEKKDIVFKNVIEDYVYNSSDILNLMLEYEVRGYLWNKLFKRESLILNDFYLEPNRHIEDWFPVFKQVGISNKIAFVNKPLYYYRQRSTSTMHNINEKHLKDFVYAVRQIQDFLKNKNYNENSYKSFNAEVFYSTRRFFYICSMRNNENMSPKEIYTAFEKSEYSNIVQLDSLYFLNGKISLKLKFKILSWKLHIFHLLFK